MKDEITSGISRREQPRAILKPQAKQYCIISRLKFMQFSLRKLIESFRKSDDVYLLPVKNCHSRTKCLDCLRRAMTDLVVKHTTRRTAVFPQTIASSYGESSFCSTCAGRLRELVEKSRSSTWNNFPRAVKTFNNADFA